MACKQLKLFSCPQIEWFLPWIVCLSASLFFFYEFIQGNMFASIADNIMQDFDIDVSGMAYLSSVYYVSNVLFLFVAGQLLDRFSTKKILVGAMGLCVLSTFVLAHAYSFYVALICRFITGIGSAFCLLGPVRIASRWFPPNKMAMMTGLIVTVAMLGGLVAQYPMTWLVTQLGWRDGVMVVGWVGVVMWVLMCLGIADAPKDKPIVEVARPSFLAMMKQAYMNQQMLRVGLFASLMNMSIAVFGAMIGTLYLMERLGVSKEIAASINGMLFLGSIVGGPLIGRWSDRLGERLLPMKTGLIGALIVTLMILYVPLTSWMMYVLFFLLGIFISAQVISYAYVAESQPHSMTATAVSIVSICTQSGYIFFQNIFSHLLAWHASIQNFSAGRYYTLTDYRFATLILPVGLILARLCLIGLKETYCHQKEG